MSTTRDITFFCNIQKRPLSFDYQSLLFIGNALMANSNHIRGILLTSLSPPCPAKAENVEVNVTGQNWNEANTAAEAALAR